MRLSSVIAALRRHCPLLAGRVSGAAEYKPLADNAKMALPSAWVIPLDDNAGEQRSQTDYWQEITDGFAVIVIMDNTPDQRGQKAAFDAVHEVRAGLWKALLGWVPQDGYHPVQYDGGNLLDMNRAHLYYQFDFSACTEIQPEDTRQWDDQQQLDTLEQADIELMAPDGETEHEFTVTLKEDSPLYVFAGGHWRRTDDP